MTLLKAITMQLGRDFCHTTEQFCIPFYSNTMTLETYLHTTLCYLHFSENTMKPDMSDKNWQVMKDGNTYLNSKLPVC